MLGLTLFYTYSAYFFKTAGVSDPFAVTCITNGVQLVIIVIVAATVDRFGRRNICCGGLSTMLVAVTLIGILGVVKQNKGTNGLLVFFSCIFSESHNPPRVPHSWQSLACSVLDPPDGALWESSRLSDSDPTPRDSPQPCPVSSASS